MAEDPPPWLKAMTLAITSSWFRDPLYPGDTFALETALSWIHGVERQEEGLRGLVRTWWSRRDVDKAAAAMPLADADLEVVGHRVDFFQDWLGHAEAQDPWWTPVDFGPAIATAPPANMVAGWYDLFLPYQLADYARLRAAGHEPRLLVGPWWHGHRDGAAALARETLDWSDVHLRGRPSKRSSDVRVFVMGADEWLDLAEWPPPSTPTAFHLQGERRLGPDEPTAADPDRFRYDPADPTPSLGGATLSSKAGPKDNAPRESRSDVLSYTTEPLGQDVTAIGDVTADLHVRSSLAHTDFFVRLCDVDPEGKSINISDGVLRLPSESAEPMSEGIMRIRIPMFPTAATFRRGHRIRLQVSSGAHPVHARNLGAGEPIASATTFRVADQEIFHDPAHPSSVILPIVQPT
jgi:putative CocE/NonD family hydrolase